MSTSSGAPTGVLPRDNRPRPLSIHSRGPPAAVDIVKSFPPSSNTSQSTPFELRLRRATAAKRAKGSQQILLQRCPSTSSITSNRPHRNRGPFGRFIDNLVEDLRISGGKHNFPTTTTLATSTRVSHQTTRPISLKIAVGLHLDVFYKT